VVMDSETVETLAGVVRLASWPGSAPTTRVRNRGRTRLR